MADSHHVTEVKYNDRGYFVTPPLYQFDYGQLLLFDGFGLPDAFEVHFSSPEDAGKSVTQIGTTTEGVSTVRIPDACLQKCKTITAWLYLHDTEDDGETRFVVEVPVRHRAEITGETPTPVEQSAITQAIAALQTAVEAAEDAAAHAVEVVENIGPATVAEVVSYLGIE